MKRKLQNTLTTLISLWLLLAILVQMLSASSKAAIQSAPASRTAYTITDLGTLGGSSNYSVANDINNNGQVVGWSYGASNRQMPFIYSNGAMTQLGVLGNSVSPNGYAQAVNDAGQAVGQSSISQDRMYVTTSCSQSGEYLYCPPVRAYTANYYSFSRAVSFSGTSATNLGVVGTYTIDSGGQYGSYYKKFYYNCGWGGRLELGISGKLWV